MMILTATILIVLSLCWVSGSVGMELRSDPSGVPLSIVPVLMLLTAAIVLIWHL